MSMKKIKRKHVGIIGWISLILGILLILLGCWLKLFWLIAAALLEMAAAIIFLAVFNRCPHCGRFLGHAGGGIHCPYCGERLDE